MTAIDLFNRLQELEIFLSLVGNKLRYDAPKGIMTPELHNAISAHKAELIELIRRGALEDLVEFHKDIGLKYTEADWQSFCAIPGWRDRLEELEEAFTRAWREGSDCQPEFHLVREHWLTAISMN
jgi:hypothetical protein